MELSAPSSPARKHTYSTYEGESDLQTQDWAAHEVHSGLSQEGGMPQVKCPYQQASEMEVTLTPRLDTIITEQRILMLVEKEAATYVLSFTLFFLHY